MSVPLANKIKSKKAVIAVCHSLLRTVYAMLRDKTPYQEPDPAVALARDRDKRIRHHAKQLLQLGMELREWDSPDARNLAATLKPLEAAAAARLKTWLPKLSYPIRSGEHSQTAFALGLILDSSHAGGDKLLYDIAAQRARGCPRPVRVHQAGSYVHGGCDLDLRGAA